MLVEGIIHGRINVLGLYRSKVQAHRHLQAHIILTKKEWIKQKDGSFMNGLEYLSVEKEKVQEKFGDEEYIREMYEDYEFSYETEPSDEE